ncbi:kinase-like domain-containing protein [Xylaria grammica]|nr:kinase-like domain-containing protein [Xylaria grammica]
MPRSTYLGVLTDLEARKVTSGGNHFIPDSMFEKYIRNMPDNERRHNTATSMIENAYPAWSLQVDDPGPIIDRGLKVFTALLMAEAEHLLPHFWKKGKLDDAKLPFTEKELRLFLPHVSETKIRLIHDKLMLLSAPRLRQGIPDTFEYTRPLPFIEITHTNGRGRNSETHVVWAPLEHLEHQMESIPRSSLRLGEWGDFKEVIGRVELVHKKVIPNVRMPEKKLLERLPPHPSLVRPICVFKVLGRDREKPESVNFLFPKFDCSLKDFILEERCEWGLPAFISAFSGLMDGLASFSEIRSANPTTQVRDIGVHHDVKPDNILVDEEGERLVLCDFGSAIVGDVYGPERRSADLMNSYQAPEVSAGGRDDHGLKKDIWAMGCILTEVVVYALDVSSHTVDEFRKSRRDDRRCHFFHREGQLHPEVTRRLSTVSDSLRAVIYNMLEIIPSKRPSARTVARNLRAIVSDPSSSEALYIESRNPSQLGLAENPIQLPLSVPRSRGSRDGEHEGQDSGDHVYLQGAKPNVDVTSILKRSNSKTMQDRYPGRIRCLWNGQSNHYCVRKWAASSSSSMIMEYSKNRDMEALITIIAARIVTYAQQANTNHHVLYYFRERTENLAESKNMLLSLAESLVC